MWKFFTERARRSVYFAQQETDKRRDDYVSTEHLLLGLLRESDNTASQIIIRMGFSTKKVLAAVERQSTYNTMRRRTELQLTPLAKQCIDFAFEEMKALSINYIGTEHLLLGLMRVDDGVAGRTLASMGMKLSSVHEEVLMLQDRQVLLRASQTTGHDLLRASTGEENTEPEDELLRATDPPTSTEPS